MTMELNLDNLLKTPKIGNVSTSPDAKWVVWNWVNLAPVRDLYFSPSDGSAPAKKITDFKQHTRFRSWFTDNKHVVVSHDYDGDERARLYLVNTETLETKPLTPEHPNYYIHGGQVTPDGKFLVYAANYDFGEQKETEIAFIYKHNLETDERIALAKPQKPGYTDVEMNYTGIYIFYTRNDINPAGVQIWLVDIDGKKDKEILNFGPTSKVWASWHNNGKDILFTTEENKFRRAGIYNIETDQIKWIVDDPKRNITSIVNPYGTDLFKITEIEDAQYKTLFVNPISFKETALPKTRTILPITPVLEDTWLSRYFNSKQPDTLVLWNTNSGQVIKNITDVFKHVPYSQEDLAKAEPYYWQSVDGLKIQGWLYKVQGKTRGTIVSVHGGPTSHSDDSFDREIQYYVSRGFNVFDPNYRGSTGFGLEFQELIKKDSWGGKEQLDILEGIKALIKDGIAEPFKVAMTGTSYGGYSSWYAITHFPLEYISVAAPICGMTDLVVDYNTTRPDLRVYGEEMMGGSPTQVPEIYKERSPINFIENIKGKLLIVQGARDPNVTPENVKAVEEKLKEYDIPYEKLIFDDEGHGISKPKNQKVLYQRIADFFEATFK
ncbi:MAG: hypothetical protein A2735_01940 [Candidatus Yanofskybacteria bacterium RIFCSPHIGHO2_01_FULL_41_21]|uniref:Peptidase S9 prolyl oligopeptidase catalytic domain-containing protein n=1 Tax=Candidatus Yanofskybacteria bacterium RIFCSPHIGHO2_01_FULL_41_21 TaxID=1802660 RepID=A0A1F8E9I4_9BACT|nr:MAG: hypothetical protein A2735_01940 [Candidatus Yanofskybacteria bacterium RIFCSPHIGHO2_01_FULL_41_21]